MSIKIEKISSVFGEYPGSVDVWFRDGDESPEQRRIALDSDVINDDGSVNEEKVYAQVKTELEGQ